VAPTLDDNASQETGENYVQRLTVVRFVLMNRLVLGLLIAISAFAQKDHDRVRPSGRFHQVQNIRHPRRAAE
jgi:hypothetical protein